MNLRRMMLMMTALSASTSVFSQIITLQPVQGQMVCGVQVPGLPRQSFALGVPETIGSSEGMILNFPEVTSIWSGPDQKGVVGHSWTTAGKIEYSVRLIPHADYVDMEMIIRNLSTQHWTNVFSFNCLNPVNALKFQDWKLERTYMSRDGNPFRMDGTTRINNGSMNTVQFYLHKDYDNVSPFVNGFSATSPDRTDDSYIVTLSDDGTSYMAATSPQASFLFDNLDRCCIHSATSFGDIAAGSRRTVFNRFYFARGTLSDFVSRFQSEVKIHTRPCVALCWGKPWELADTTQWNYVFNNIDVFKFYIGDILNATGSRVDSATAKTFVGHLVKRKIRIAVENGGLLDWYADKGDRAAELSFNEDFSTLRTLIRWIKETDPARSIDMLDFDGPIRRMLYPNDQQKSYHTIQSAVTELFKLVTLWRDSVPGIELNLLTNFPNWAWGTTPAYYFLFGSANGYGHYEDVLNAVHAESQRTGLRFDAITIDNPYDYVTGQASSNQPGGIAGIDWMKRIAELADSAKAAGYRVNMIFNTNGGTNAQGYSEQTLAMIDVFHQKTGMPPDGYWIQSWYQLPDKWLPETERYTMTNIALEAIKKIKGGESEKKHALLEPGDGRVYHGACTMTYESGDPLAGYLGALNDSALHPAVRSFFVSIPGERGPDNVFTGIKTFLQCADSVGFIPELSLFFVDQQGSTDSIVAVSSAHDWVIDSVITLSKSYGKSMFLRIGGEFSGYGPGWNGGGYHPYYYVTMFRKIVNMYVARGFRDSIAVNWCYEPDAPNDFDSVDAQGARWYPGDEFVDWFGLDVFDPAHFDQSLSNFDRRGITRKGKSERFLSMARAKNKPVFLSETSAKGMNISADNQDGIDDWNNWFAKFWQFIDVHTEIKGFCYINANWPASAYADWGDARIQNSPNVTQEYREELKKGKYIHLGRGSITGITNESEEPIPADFVLHQNYPNPFNPTTVICYQLPVDSDVRLAVYDILGRETAILMDGRQLAGSYEVVFDAADFASGVYFCRLQAGTFVCIRTMLFLR